MNENIIIETPEPGAQPPRHTRKPKYTAITSMIPGLPVGEWRRAKFLSARECNRAQSSVRTWANRNGYKLEMSIDKLPSGLYDLWFRRVKPPDPVGG